MAKCLIVGCGDIGIPLGLQLVEQGHVVWGLRRSSELPAPISTITADVCRPETLTVLASHRFDYVVVTLTPGGFNDEAYRSVYVEGLANVLAALGDKKTIQRLIFVSSSSVYQQGNGEWVDEDSPTTPDNFSGQRLLQAEQLLSEQRVKHTVIRFAGIYGPGRNRLIEQVKARQGCAQFPELFTNRIHRDDCVGFIQHLISMDLQGLPVHSCYIGVDSEPVSLWQVKRWLAGQMNIDPAELSTDSETRRSSKRCSNQRLLASGYQLLYPGYQQGYAELLKAGN